MQAFTQAWVILCFLYSRAETLGTVTINISVGYANRDTGGLLLKPTTLLTTHVPGMMQFLSGVKPLKFP